MHGGFEDFCVVDPHFVDVSRTASNEPAIHHLGGGSESSMLHRVD